MHENEPYHTRLCVKQTKKTYLFFFFFELQKKHTYLFYWWIQSPLSCILDVAVIWFVEALKVKQNKNLLILKKTETGFRNNI